MGFKLNALVVAAAMTASLSMNANADVARANTGNSEMLFTVYTLATGKATSYALDTGLFLNAFTSGVATNTSWTFNVDANYTNWYNSLDNDQKSGLKWNFIGADSTGVNNFITTLDNTINGITTVAAQRNDYTRNFAGKFDFLASGMNNVTPGADTATNGSVVAANSTADGYAGTLDGNWGSNLKFGNASADIGTSLNLYKITALATGTAASVWAQQAYAGNNYLASFDGAALTISSVAAVPEMNTSAMMLAGIGLMGFIARRRKSV